MGPSSRTVICAAAAAVAAIGACHGPTPASREPLRVAAAADLADAFAELGKDFTAKTGTKVAVSFGSTGLLAKQIAEGAPFQVFAAANVSFVDDVVKTGSCLGDTKKTYARGRIVLWASDRSKLPATLDGLRDPRFVKIALANPDHAPYGIAAKQALQKAGLWKDLEPRAVYGENVQQTLTFAKSGNAEVAFIALSLAVNAGGGYLDIDPSLHEPLDQAMVVCKGGASGGQEPAARAFVDYVGSDAGRATMRRYGFLLPGETLAPK